MPVNLTDPADSLRHMDVGPGEIVAVQGIGGLGHLALQFASKMGYRTVALSSSDSKRQLATELGAVEYVRTIVVPDRLDLALTL
jgi:D-arabinose 1-dehydrogenase-like Zn-dependent alcohol dehydrogenase